MSYGEQDIIGGTIWHAPSSLIGRMFRLVMEAEGHPALNRVTRMPYNQASRVGGEILYFGIQSQHSATTDGLVSDVALMPDQLEDFALLRSLQALSGYRTTHDFCRVIVQSGMLETDGVTF